MSEINRDGLGWQEDGLDRIPVWMREPSTVALETVCRQRLQTDPSSPCRIKFYAEGAFNKLYLVETDQKCLLVRVSLPICPRHKTRGEVTTMRWMREHTDLPVPEVIDFDDGNKNEIGFEWMIMEKMPGSTLHHRWRSMSYPQKVFLTVRIAKIQAQLFRHASSSSAFRGIGTLEPCSLNDNGPVPGQLVSTEFFMHDHIDYDVPRGPFRSSHDWLLSQLKIAVLENEVILADPEAHEDYKEEAQEKLTLAKRLLSFLPKLFPSVQEPPERTVLWHQDLDDLNILVNDQNRLTAVLDWECVSAVPLWMATSFPKFLDCPDKEEEPSRDDYLDADPVAPASADEETDPYELDNEGKNGLYWIHLKDYETTQLRKIFHGAMQDSWPEWDLLFAEGRVKRDFHKAVQICFSNFFQDRALEWLDRMEDGEFVDLHTVLDMTIDQ